MQRQISGRWFYNGKLWWNNPDTFHVYAGGLYTYNMGKVHASFCAITGNVSSLGEPFADQKTPQERLEIIRKVSPATGDTSVAVDMFRNNPARLWNMRVDREFGSWNVVGLFNLDPWQKKRCIRETIRFNELGLSAGKEYLVYEFWNRAFLGSFKEEFSRSIEPIDCEIYSIVEKQPYPQLISTSRHVRHMAYDVVDLLRNEKERRLSGTSRVIGGYPHDLVVHLPEGFTPVRALAAGSEVSLSREGEILSVAVLPRETGKISWQIDF